MQGVFFVVNSKDTLKSLTDFLSGLFEEKKYYRVQISTRRERTMPQNALFQVWTRELAAIRHGKKVMEVTEKEHEDCKLSLKREYYRQEAQPFMIDKVVDTFNGQIGERMQSTTRLDTGEIYMFMDWIQKFAAEYGCMLESRGEYKELRQDV